MIKEKNKRWQKENLHLNKEISNLNFSLRKKTTKAQEEMVGFGLIIVIVAVILLVFLWFSLVKPVKQDVDNYEVDSFIQSFLQYTTDCEHSIYGYIDIQDLISWCGNNDKTCGNGESSCDMLEDILRDIIQESWQIGENRPVKGYFLNISVEGEQIISFDQGNITVNSKGASQDFSKSGKSVDIFFKVYTRPLDE